MLNVYVLLNNDFSINCVLLYFVKCIVLCKMPSFCVAVESLPPLKFVPLQFKSSYFVFFAAWVSYAMKGVARCLHGSYLGRCKNCRM